MEKTLGQSGCVTLVTITRHRTHNTTFPATATRFSLYSNFLHIIIVHKRGGETIVRISDGIGCSYAKRWSFLHYLAFFFLGTGISQKMAERDIVYLPFALLATCQRLSIRRRRKSARGERLLYDEIYLVVWLMTAHVVDALWHWKHIFFDWGDPSCSSASNHASRHGRFNGLLWISLAELYMYCRPRPIILGLG